MKAFARLTGGPDFTPQENCVLMTVSVAATAMVWGGSMPFAILAMSHEMRDAVGFGDEDSDTWEPTVWRLIAYSAALCFIGFCLAIPLRKKFVVDDPLPFPYALAAAKTIRSLHQLPVEPVVAERLASLRATPSRDDDDDDDVEGRRDDDDDDDVPVADGDDSAPEPPSADKESASNDFSQPLLLVRRGMNLVFFLRKRNNMIRCVVTISGQRPVAGDGVWHADVVRRRSRASAVVWTRRDAKVLVAGQPLGRSFGPWLHRSTAIHHL